MKLSAPKTNTWIASVVLGGLGILGEYVAIPYVTEYNWYLLVIGFIVLTLATLLRGL